MITRALETGAVVRHRDESTRIFGPYWADEAVVLTVGDFVIVMGGRGVTDHGEDVLMEVAGDLAYSVGDVPAEKRLADELEVTKAALAVASLPRATMDQFLSNLAGTAMEALGCEFGAVVLRQPEPRLLMAPSGWRPSASDDLVLGSLLQLTVNSGTPKPVVAQDLRNEPSAQSPLGFDEGLVSRCVIPLTVTEVCGAIVVAHTMKSAPRGFTNLCQLVAASIGDQATKMLDTSFAGDAARSTEGRGNGSRV